MQQLIERSYLTGLMKNYDRERATPNEALPPGISPPAEPQDTTHHSVIDAAGRAVSNTYTLNERLAAASRFPAPAF